MDRLFRKRTMSTKEAHGLPMRSASSPVDPMWPERATLRKKRRDRPEEKRPGSGTSSTTGEAPRVELNIRNSLMLPGLSQRFSVLLPSLSSMPAESLRDQLASQRQRGGAGPAITEEEEELLFAELRDIEAWRQTRHEQDMVSVSPTIPMEWDGRPPLSSTFSSSSLANWENESRREGHGHGSGATSPISPISASSSAPNLLSAALSRRDTSTSPTSPTSPPATSASYDSFATFGVNDAADRERGSAGSIRTKSYGFSGGSGMRDHEYIRRVKKSASSRNISGSSRSISIRSDDSDETARNKEAVPRLPPIMTDLQHPQPGRRGRGGSPDGSERTATPSTGLDTFPSSSTSFTKLHHSPGSTLSLSLGSPPLHPAPESPLPPTPPTNKATLPTITPNGSKGQRKSMLQGLSQAQMKRISAALLEIGYGAEQPGRRDWAPQPGHDEAYEETLEAEMKAQQPRASTSTRPSAESPRKRYDSNPKSEESADSAGSSSIFPYHVSPTTSSFAGAVQVQPPSQPSSPPGVVSVPVKTRDFGLPQPRQESPAQANPPPDSGHRPLVITEAARPVPVLTPTKSRPVRHNANPSTDSAGYVPGQMRPVGSVRSDGSSSRSGTPTNVQRTADLISPNRERSGSSPMPLKPPQVQPRTTSLARSLSIQQQSAHSVSPPPPGPFSASSTSSRAETSPDSLVQPNQTQARVNSPLRSDSHEGVIEEGDETESEAHDFESDETPDLMIRTVPSRRSVARSHSESIASASPNSGDLASLPMPIPPQDVSRAASQQGFIDAYSYSDHGPSRHTSISAAHPVTPNQTLRNMTSMDSIGSGYQAPRSNDYTSDDAAWSPGDVIMTPDEDTSGELKLLCGLEKEEFRQMQIMLINKARAEREALRGEMDRPFSPTQPKPIEALALDLKALRATSPPPMTYRATTPDITQTRPVPTSPVFLGNVYTPPQPETRKLPVAADLTAPALAVVPTPPLQTPSEQHDEIFTPPSEQLSRQPSQKVQITPTNEDDPEKVRDFEARIAAATAALNRTPSSTGFKLERKGTRKASGGPMVISTPKLLSSSINLATQRLESPESVDTHTAKALENASGSSKKMSLRWRKLGFGKKSANTSISSNADMYSPPSSASGSPNPQTLEEPIALSAPPAIPPVPRSAPIPTTNSDFKGFKFPLQVAAAGINGPMSKGGRHMVAPPTVAEAADIKQVPAQIKQVNGDATARTARNLPVPAQQLLQPSSAPAQLPSQPTSERHAPPASDDSVAKFIAAGRAVGLNDAQLNDMLIANGMIKPDQVMESKLTNDGVATPAGLGKAQIIESTVTSVADPTIKDPVTEEKQDKPSGGIFRALSRKKSRPELKAPKQPTSSGTTTSADPAESRNKVVRRTLLLPEGLPSTPQPYLSPNINSLDSPTGVGRKPSTRRKPVNLTEEDERLVAASPESKSRKPSSSSVLSALDERGGKPGATAGLGFLQPPHDAPDRVARERESSATSGGSFYDYYDNDDNTESAVRETKQGIEIMEYEDGRVVWGVIDALRDDDDDEAGGSEYTQTALHSRQTSNASSHLLSDARDSPRPSAAWRGPVAPLNLRHRDRGAAAVRPETNLYFTSPTDIGDLIDQLSRDPTGNKGRIDFLPPSPNPAVGPSSMPSQSLLTPATPGAPGQFEDAPSPRKSPPPPISVGGPGPGGRTNNIPAGGFSPKRQKYVRQNFGRSAGTNGLPAAMPSPSAASFASSHSGMTAGKPVEDRLQALMDRLISSGATRKV